MAFETAAQPYEFLARWDQNGRLAGAHVQRRVITRSDGAILGEFVTPAEPVALDGNGAFPLTDIMTEVQVGAVAQANALADQLAAAQAALAAMSDQRDAALARVAELEAAQSPA